MQSPFDTLAKGLIDASLAPWCAVSIQQPVSMDTLYADALVEPRPGAQDALSARGLLGRMAMSPCVIEPFALTPTVVSVDRCMARTSMLRAEREVPFGLWLITPGVPSAVIDAWRLVEDPAWGGGVFLASTPRAPRVVVAAALPRSRDTLLLRLMGRGLTLRYALEDFEALPFGAWERGFIPRLLLRVRGELVRMGAAATNSEELQMRYQEIVAETDRVMDALRAEGRAEGRALALRDAVFAMCEVLGVPLDEARRDAVAKAPVGELEAMLDALRRTRTLP